MKAMQKSIFFILSVLLLLTCLVGIGAAEEPPEGVTVTVYNHVTGNLKTEVDQFMTDNSITDYNLIKHLVVSGGEINSNDTSDTFLRGISVLGPSIETIDFSATAFAGNTVPGYAFQYCTALSQVILPDSVTAIGLVAFYGCSSLQDISMPASLAYIGNSAFRECSSLENINLHGVETIENNAFENCSELKDIYINSPNPPTASWDSFRVQFPGTVAVHVPNGSQANYWQQHERDKRWCGLIIEDPASPVPELWASEAERTSDTAATVTLYADEPCAGFFEIVEDGAAEPVIETTGDGESFTEEWFIYNGNDIYSLRAVLDITGLQAGPKDIYIKLKDIRGNISESYKIDLEGFVVPIDVTIDSHQAGNLDGEIQSNMTAQGMTVNYKKIKSLTIKGGVMNDTDWNVIRSNTNKLKLKEVLEAVDLSEVNLDNNCIPDYVFYYLTKLANVKLPGNIESIGEYTFSGCSSLVSISIPVSTPPSVGEGAFGGIAASAAVHVPAGSKDAYKAVDDGDMTDDLWYGMIITPPTIPVNPTGVSLNRITLILKEQGESVALTATVTPVNATNKNVTWISSNTIVATVNEGVVTPLAAGIATITATTVDGGKTATCEVTVTEQVTAAHGDTVSINTAPVTITVPNNATDTRIDVAPDTALPLVEVNTSTSLGTVQMTIPDGTTVSGPAGWSGEITLPTVKASSSAVVTGAQSVNVVVEVGLGNETIIFSKAVRLLIPDMAGKSAGYVRNGAFTAITRIISADSQSVADAEIPANGDGKIDVGNDLVIWTKHFTEFIAYTPAAGSSGGGDSGISNPQYFTSTTGSASVYPGAGAKVGLNSDATVEIPANALKGTSSVMVKVQKVDSSIPIEEGFKLISNIFEFTIDGQTNYSFNQPVTLTFKLNTTGDEIPVIYYYDNQAVKWIKVGGTVSGSTISVSVDHFTKFAVIATIKADVTQPAEQELSDIKGHWAEKAINTLVHKGIIGGYPDGTFKPDRTISRAEFAVMLVNAYKLEAKDDKVFNDTESHWAKGFISTASAHGIINGYNKTSFGPDDSLIREQMAVMAVKAARLIAASSPTTFNDRLQISNWAGEAVSTTVKAGIMQGYPDNNFKPQGEATRAEAVMVINNLIK